MESGIANHEKEKKRCKILAGLWREGWETINMKQLWCGVGAVFACKKAVFLL